MSADNPFFTEYQARITAASDRYLMQYEQEVPREQRTLDAAGQFLMRHNDAFRREVASIGVDMLHNSGLDRNMQQLILEYNSWAVSKLFVDVMNASTPDGRPFLETRI